MTTAKIANGAVGTADIANAAVGSTQLAAGSVSQTHLTGESVGTAQLINQSVTEGKLADNAVTTAKIANDSISGAKIQAGAVTQSQAPGLLAMTQNNLRAEAGYVTCNPTATGWNYKDVNVGLNNVRWVLLSPAASNANKINYNHPIGMVNGGPIPGFRIAYYNTNVGYNVGVYWLAFGD